MTAEQYFALLFDIAGNARRSEKHFNFGMGHLTATYSSALLEKTLSRAMKHIEAIEPFGDSLEIRCMESVTTGIAIPPPVWSVNDFLDRDAIRGWEAGRFRAQYSVDRKVLQLMDCQLGLGLYWVKDGENIAWWEQTFPFRQLIHWWSATRPLQLIHAGAVGFESGGVLIAGPSGSGKSTSCLSCLNSSLFYAGDDYVLVDLAHEKPFVQSLYGTAKIVPDNLHRVHWLDEWITNKESLETQKAVVYVNEMPLSKMVQRMPIRAVVLPKVSGLKDSTLTPASSMDAIKAIAPTCLFHLAGDSSQTMQKISRLTKAVPAYWLHAGTELEQIPMRITELIEELS